jgi:hypothetical protein
VSRRPCAVDGCEKQGRRKDPLCAAHRMRKVRNGILGPAEVRQYGPDKTLFEAAISLGNADEDEEFKRAKERHRKAAVRYSEHLRRRLTDNVGRPTDP